MKNSILSLGKVLNKEMQQAINGGDCVYTDGRHSYRGPCPTDENTLVIDGQVY